MDTILFLQKRAQITCHWHISSGFLSDIHRFVCLSSVIRLFMSNSLLCRSKKLKFYIMLPYFVFIKSPSPFETYIFSHTSLSFIHLKVAAERTILSKFSNLQHLILKEYLHQFTAQLSVMLFWRWYFYKEATRVPTLCKIMGMWLVLWVFFCSFCCFFFLKATCTIGSFRAEFGAPMRGQVTTRVFWKFTASYSWFYWCIWINRCQYILSACFLPVSIEGS